MKPLRPLAAPLLAAVLGACGDPPLVEDAAELLDAGQQRRLAEHHGNLLADHDIDYRIVTGRDLPEINRHANALFSDLEVGARSDRGRGLLLVIDAGRDRVRLELGYALEGVFPDAFVAYVEARQMVPFFRAGRVADGILATTELIIDRVQRAKAGGGYEDEVWMAGSGGAGATRDAEIGSGRQPARPRRAVSIGSGRSPLQTLALYFQAMDARNADPGLPIYTPATRRMLARWVVTPAQMDNVVRTYRRCGEGTPRRDPSGERAVVRYRIEARACAPWFFRRTGPDWQLDLSVMSDAIRFGRDNSWRFHGGVPEAYAFAFEDWRLDARGYPRGRWRCGTRAVVLVHSSALRYRVRRGRRSWGRDRSVDPRDRRGGCCPVRLG